METSRTTVVDRIKRLRAVIAKPRTYVAWYGANFAIFLTTHEIAAIKRVFVDVLEGVPEGVKYQQVRCREIPTLGHRLTPNVNNVSTGVLFTSWKAPAGKVSGWNTDEREDAVRWFLMGGGISDPR